MSGPTPAVAAVRVAVRAALAELELPAGGPVLVGCSGGTDSMALAAAVAFEAPRAQLRAGAVIVEHGLTESVGEQVAGWCRDLGLDPVDVLRVTVAPDGQGVEAAARDARYRAFEQALDTWQAEVLLLGHTLDDQAEQVLLGLARGSGARSLAGMPAARGRYRRPLLTLPRTTLRQAITDQGLPCWEDPSNSDPAFTRNRVRHRVLPVLEDELGPGITQALARTAEQLRADADALDALAGELLEQARDERGALRTRTLQQAPAALRHRALRRAAVEAGVPAGRLHRTHVLAMDALITGWRGQGPVDLPRSRRLGRRDGMLEFDGTPVPGRSSHGSAEPLQEEESWTQRTSPEISPRSS